MSISLTEPPCMPGSEESQLPHSKQHLLIHSPVPAFAGRSNFIHVTARLRALGKEEMCRGS